MNNLKKQIQLVLNLYTTKSLVKAETLCKKLIHENPKMVVLLNIMGLILTEQNKISGAIEYYEKGIKINPKYSMIYNNLGSIYKSQKEYIKAENYYKKSIEIDNKLSEPHNNLGNLYLAINKYDDAVDSYKKAININPNFFIAHFNLGIIYKNIGEFEKAKKHLKEAIKLDENFYSAHRALSQIIKYSHEDKHLTLLKKIYTKKENLNKNKTEIAFSIAKAYDDIKDYKNAIKYYHEGNNLRKKQISFSIKEIKEEFNKIKNIFNKDFFSKRINNVNNDETPIFILGMPRSGTTLVEQILSSHNDVYGGDELFYFQNLIQKNFNDLNDIVNIDDNTSYEISKEYINSLKKLSNNSKKVTDKLPINFKWIGLIKKILPNSTIIHCQRNAKDTCLSIYKNYFTNPKLNFAYDLDDISIYYSEYRNLMNHWYKLLPDKIYNINYEKLVQEPKKEIKSLLNFCKLKFDKNCLDFSKNKRAIKTASDTQARKKVYKSSINLWKNYEKYLKTFYKTL